MSSLLRVQQVCKTYGSKRVVDKVSFEVNRGEILGFLGPNGAGKTTTIRMVMGITAPDSGSIEYSFSEGASGPIHKSRIGYLPEERGLYKEARVIDILLFLAGLKKMDTSKARKRINAWLEKFDLRDRAHAKVEELSKGMAQKVQFIAACIHEPEFLVLDEPFSGLDPLSQDFFKAEIKELAARGTAILLSSHQMNMVEEICDRIYLLHQGREVFYGSLGEIKARYGSYRAMLQSESTDWLEPLKDSGIIEKVERNGSYWQISLSKGVRPASFLSSIPEDAAIQEISVQRSSLHDIFIKVAKGGAGSDFSDHDLGNHAQFAQ